MEDLLDEPKREPQPGEPRWDKPSRAVVISDGKFGSMPWHCGPHVEQMIDDLGNTLEVFPGDPSPGVWIWEGTMGGGERMSTQDGIDYTDTYLIGAFRQPTDEEWAAIREGRCPWNPKEWVY